MTEDEAKKYYQTHMNEFTTPPSVTLREIQATVAADARGINVAADDAAKTRIEELRTRVTTGGESFEKLAAEVSDSPSKANGGLIGPISLNDVNAELRKLIESMKVGDVSEVIRLPRGYQILKLETLAPAQTMTFEQAREQIGERVFTDKRRAEFQKYLEKLRAQAIIEWKNQDVKKAFEQGLKQQAAPARPSNGPRYGAGGVVRHLDAVAARAGGARSARAEAPRSLSPHHHALEPLEGSQEEDRLAAVPGYCFARFDPADALPVLKCTGVVNIVSFEGKPAPIPAYELDSIRVLVGSDLQFDPCPMIREGMMVEVVHGPLRGVVGRLMRKDAPKARLVLSVDLIGQAVSVEVDAADVKAY